MSLRKITFEESLDGGQEMSQTNIERMNIGRRENIKCKILKQELACHVKEGAGRSVRLVASMEWTEVCTEKTRREKS